MARILPEEYNVFIRRLKSTVRFLTREWILAENHRDPLWEHYYFSFMSNDMEGAVSNQLLFCMQMIILISGRDVGLIEERLGN